MSQTLWRIATDTPHYQAHDMAGKGAEATGGRWNMENFPVTYTSTTRALACLETVVHLNAGDLPLNRYLVEITVPDAVWSAAQVAPTGHMVGWDAEPAGQVSIDYGTQWLTAFSSALLIVPSVIVPEENNVLINPGHTDSASILAVKNRKWVYDARLKTP